MSAIPDPDDPTKRAIDGDTGELLGGVFFLPDVPADRAPTLAELQNGVHIGWSKGPFGEEREHE